jgi:hypothetical protein
MKKLGLSDSRDEGWSSALRDRRPRNRTSGHSSINADFTTSHKLMHAATMKKKNASGG